MPCCAVLCHAVAQAVESTASSILAVALPTSQRGIPAALLQAMQASAAAVLVYPEHVGLSTGRVAA